MKYMLLMHTPYGTGDYDVQGWSPADLQRMVQHMKGLNEELKRAGELVGAEGLTAPAQARFVKAAEDGKPVVTDGPFAESKEFLAGYWVVDVPTPERAYEIAARVSMVPGPGGKPLHISLEVRPVGVAPA